MYMSCSRMYHIRGLPRIVDHYARNRRLSISILKLQLLFAAIRFAWSHRRCCFCRGEVGVLPHGLLPRPAGFSMEIQCRLLALLVGILLGPWPRFPPLDGGGHAPLRYLPWFRKLVLGLLGPLLGSQSHSWAGLGELLGHLGAVLGHSWTALGGPASLLEHPGRLPGRPGAVQSRSKNRSEA